MHDLVKRGLVGLGAAAAWAGFAAGAVPPKVVTVSQWAQANRVVSAEEGSPYPGKWDNARTPYLVEPMDCMGFDHPAREVTLRFSAQTGKSAAGQNFFGYVVDHAPAPTLIVLPSLEEASKYNKVKLQPAIEATPALKAKIRATNSRDEDSSTATFKRFAGGYAVITGANSSKGLQMISARVRIYEEVSEFPADADGRGEPTFQAESRGKAWTERGSKSIYISTPGLKGSCRVTTKYEASDQRRYYVACPQCGHFQVLQWKNLKWDSEIAPHGAHFVCVAHGCIIEPRHKTSMLAAVPGWRWIKTYPGDEANPAPPESFPHEEFERWADRGTAGRQPGFALWQSCSSFVPWDATVAEYFDALKGGPTKLKTFTQQALGEDWEEKGEAPDDERLFERREKYPAKRLVPGALFLVGTVDVQGDRLEYAVYGYERGLSSWLVDVGVVAGDPALPETWSALDPVIAARYEDAWGRSWPVDAWGIDTGYATQSVYRYVRTYAATGRVFAVDGRPGWKLAPLGTPQTKDVDHAGKKIGSVQLWPVGTWDLKSEVYAALRLTLRGADDDGRWPAGAMHFFDRCDREFFKQITAEYLADRVTPSGYTAKEWRKVRANEQLDLAVYSRALAHHLSDSLTPAQWDALAAQRLGKPQDMQGDLAALWAPGLATVSAAAAPASPPLPPTPTAVTDARANAVRPAVPPAGDRGGWISPRGKDWIRRS